MAINVEVLTHSIGFGSNLGMYHKSRLFVYMTSKRNENKFVNLFLNTPLRMQLSVIILTLKFTVIVL